MEAKKNMEKMDVKDFVVCIVLPFVLFWGGLFVGASFDSIIVYLASMLPFYIYVYIGTNACNDHFYRDFLALSSCFGVVSLVAVVIAFFTGFFPQSGYFIGLLRASATNAVVMTFYAFFGILCVANGWRWGCVFNDWPKSK